MHQLPPPDEDSTTQSMPWLRVSLLAVLWGAWLALFWPNIKWLYRTLTHEQARLSAWLVVGCVLFGLRHLFMERKRWSLAPLWPPRLHWNPTATALLLLAAALYLWLERTWDVDMLSALCLGLGSYGMIGLHVPPKRWRGGFVVALLLVSLLPFGTHMEQLVGFPARVLTAQWSQQVLALTGVTSLSTQSILILEKGLAHVDLPCSGIKSLWTGAIFFLALSWMERIRLGGLWLLSGAIFVMMLLLANVFRVVVLILVAIQLQTQTLAEIIHVPLGIIGFLGAGGVVYLLLLWVKKRQEQHKDPTASTHTQPLHWAGLLGLTVAVLVMSQLYHKRAATQTKALAWHFVMPQKTHTKPLPLSPSERDLFRRFGHTQVRKFHFADGPLKGSLLLVKSTSWRSHHPPEICLAGNGHAIRSVHTAHWAPQRPYRLIQLRGHKGTAIYWYQSAHKSTDVMLQRILGSLQPQHKEWVMVSLLFAHKVTPHTKGLRAFLQQLHQHIARSFKPPKTNAQLSAIHTQRKGS